MKNPQTIALGNGTTLVPGDGFVLCRDRNNKDVHLSLEKQRLIMALIDNLNYPVYKETLYKAYTQCDYGYDPSRVAGMIYNMPSCIRPYILTERGIGYRLVGHIENHQRTNYTAPVQDSGSVDQMFATNKSLEFLTGDYYGFFLDPVGLGTVLGAYIHIEDCSQGQEPELAVSAVLGIRSDQALFGDGIGQIFSGGKANNYNRYQTFYAGLGENDRRCFWCDGNVRMRKTAAEFTLSTPTDTKWSLLIELSNYFEGRRNRHSGDDGKYRGGLGLYMALLSPYGIFAGKFGMVRKELYKPNRQLNHSETQKMLKLSTRDGRIPLMVDPREDNYWYSWFMSE